MAGLVFISCGQRGTERDVAESVAELLKARFGLNAYLAFKIQSFDDVMTITRELRSSDYFLFIDFARTSSTPADLPCSLFTHQELALAHHVGFEIIALQQQGAPLEGFLRYVLSNPEIFSDADDLLKKVERLVNEKGWNPRYSRNLVPSNLSHTKPLVYGDHAGSSRMRAWEIQIHNRRPDTAAVNTVCVLESVSLPDGTRQRPDNSYLKWSGQAGYERTILPEDFAVVDLFSVRAGERGIFLLSLRDAYPRLPIVEADGEYQLHYKVHANGFPLLRFSVHVSLHWKFPDEDEPPSTRAILVSQIE